MTSLNGNIFRVTGHLCGEFTGHRWIPHTKASDAELWCFLWYLPEYYGWLNNREAGDLRRYLAHYDVIVMSAISPYLNQWWSLVNWTIRNRLQWNMNQDVNLSVKKWFENVFCKISAIFQVAICWRIVLSTSRNRTIGRFSDDYKCFHQIGCLFNCQYNLTSKKTSRARTTGPLWGESTGNRWIPHHNGLVMRKMSPCHDNCFFRHTNSEQVMTK